VVEETEQKGRRAKSPSFLQSSNGIYTLACLYYSRIDNSGENQKKADNYVQLVLKASKK
jgi:hypothetical protein